MTVQRMKENYKELGVKGSLRLFGVKLRSVWLVGDDDFTKMTYVSSDYRHVNEYLNGKYFVEIIFTSPQDNVNLPIYDTANYDVYPNGYVRIQGRKKKNADLLFSVSGGKR